MDQSGIWPTTLFTLLFSYRLNCFKNSMSTDCVILHNGVRFPKLHFGTYQLAGTECLEAVKCALETGYVGIDTATIYRNEQIVADGIGDSSVFLTTKINPFEAGYEETLLAFEKSLSRLRRDSVDLLLIHWPGKAKLAPSDSRHRQSRIETWKAFERIYKEGRAKAIGVSNFTIDHLEQLKADGAEIVPMVNQVEVHVCLSQRELYKYCSEHKIILQAYSPLGGRSAPVLAKIESLSIRKNSAAVALKAVTLLSDSVVVKSATPSRITENFFHFNDQSWSLTESDIQKLSDLDKGIHYCWNPYTLA